MAQPPEADDRLAMLGHELRTPLTAIIGFAGLLRQDLADQPSGLEMLELIVDSAEHLLQVADGMLASAPAPAAAGAPPPPPCDPWLVACRVARGLEVQSTAKRLAVRVVARGSIPAFIPVDAARLRQILTNLVANAVRYTAQGGIRLEVSAPEGKRIAFSVYDTGPGIAPHLLEQIFQARVQLDPAAAEGGRGLGLWIARTLAQQLGGEILVHSRPGQGTVFRLELPLVKGAAGEFLAHDEVESDLTPLTQSAVRSEARPLAGYAILVADDFPANRLLVSSLLKRHGAGVTLVTNGRDALERVREAERCRRPFDLVVMDIQMPDLDGISATAQIRAAGSAVPILGFTADLTDQLRAEHRRLGFSAIVQKPFEFPRFLAMVVALANGRDPEAAPEG